MYVDFSFVEFIFPCLITLQQEIEVLLNNGKLIAKNYKGYRDKLRVWLVKLNKIKRL